MLLSELLRAADIPAGNLTDDPDISGVSADSRKVEPGSVFVATKGVQVDSHLFLSDAVERGAAVLVVEQGGIAYDGVVVIQVEDSRDTLGRLAHGIEGCPSEDMLVLGVTGTNGKTTSVYLLEAMLTAAGYNVGVIGTIEYRYGGYREEASNTTPSSMELARLFRNMKEAGVNAVAMEVSSHAADQRRISGIKFDGCIITNITQDHLDYHGTMERYAAAKLEIFTDFLQRALDRRTRKPVSVLNIDSPMVKEFADRGCIPEKILTISLESDGADFMAYDIRFGANATTFKMKMANAVVELNTHLVGLYNVQNVLGTVALVHACGLSLDNIRDGLDAIEVVPGRLEPVRAGQPFLALVDYAHTPDALERVLTNARGMTDGKLIVVFGCGGDRDPGKRPIMGRAAVTLADLAIVTNDNPRTEDPEKICGDILAGIAEAGVEEGRFRVELDRRAAIGLALAAAEPGDIVVIAGKGHEDYQIIGKEKQHFDDREEVRNFLKVGNGHWGNGLSEGSDR